MDPAIYMLLNNGSVAELTRAIVDINDIAHGGARDLHRHCHADEILRTADSVCRVPQRTPHRVTLCKHKLFMTTSP